MSSFNGIPFQIEAADSRWLPQPNLDDDGKYVFTCRAFFDTLAHRNQMMKHVSIVTWKRPLGTIGIIGHVEAGRGRARLSIPETGDSRANHTAVLVGMTNIQLHATHKNRGYMADLSFVLLSDPA